MNEEKMNRIRALIDEIQMLLDTDEQEAPGIEEEADNGRTNLRIIREGDTQFHLFGVDIVEMNKPISGTKKDGTEWIMQSIKVADEKHSMMLLVAWDESISLFNKLSVGDRIDVRNCFKAEEYKGKIQVNLGKFAKIEVKKFSGDQHRL